MRQARCAVTSHAAARTQTPSGLCRAEYSSAIVSNTCSASALSFSLIKRLRITGMPPT